MTPFDLKRLRFLRLRVQDSDFATQPLVRQSYHPVTMTRSTLEDEGAVDRVLGGDASAFAPIVQRWQGPLVNLAYRFCRDRSRAEDMAQEAFLRAFRGLRRWRREAAFSTWLFALATNLFRSEMRRSPPVDVLQQDELKSWDPVLVEDAAANEETVRRIHRLVHSLPPKYRDVLILFYFHDMDVVETACSLQLPEGTIKARLSRARNLLRDKLTHSTEPFATRSPT
jgi:RNA polymerase sigma-70 factor (ECF subfamily)